MQKNKDVDQKIANLLSGNATKQEELDVISWINESPENNYEFLKLKEFWHGRTADVKLIHHESQKWEIWQNLQKTVEQSKPINTPSIFTKVYWRVAAVILLLLVPAILLIWSNGQESAMEDLPQCKIIVKSNPSGQKSQFQLPDGSMVWLNAESTLTYLENFSDSIRSIKLNGEAFFEVKRDTERPFFVESQDLRISVLGTEFNVTAYNNEPDITVALIKGSVKVSLNNEEKEEILLSPGYAIAYKTENRSHETFAFSDDPYSYQKNINWMSGILAFDGQNFDEFLKQIERWYGVETTIFGTPPENWRIRASFKNEYLTNVLDAISFNKEFEYNIENKHLKLIFN